MLEEFPCAVASKLNDAAVYNIMPAAKSGALWTKTLSWIQKFLVFARHLSKQAGKHLTDQQLLASNNMCRHFITSVNYGALRFQRMGSIAFLVQATMLYDFRVRICLVDAPRRNCYCEACRRRLSFQ